MQFDTSLSMALLVMFLGGVNWIATEIVVTSVIFKDIREVADKWGKRVSGRHPRVGEKISYFLKCALCVGIWIGFIEAIAFGGPLHTNAVWASWAMFVANGLLYKAVGHLLLQVNGWFHHRIELMKQQSLLTEQDTLLRCSEVELFAGQSNTPSTENSSARV